jgi:glycosyltransferase involved in cell wall biosynthesis
LGKGKESTGNFSRMREIWAAREYVEQNVTWDRHLKQLIEIYRKIARGDR